MKKIQPKMDVRTRYTSRDYVIGRVLKLGSSPSKWVIAIDGCSMETTSDVSLHIKKEDKTIDVMAEVNCFKARVKYAYLISCLSASRTVTHSFETISYGRKSQRCWATQ